MNRMHARHAAAFTLIELMISASLMALILASAYLCLNAALSGQKLIEPRADVIQNARVAMALMTADLRNACPLSKDIDLLGMHRELGSVTADNLDFGTHNYTPLRPGEGDFCQVSYFVDREPQSGQLSLWRRRNPRIGLDPLSGGSREELARGVAGVRFAYYDGLDWYNSWGDVEGRGKARTSRRERSNLYGLPEAIRITLAFDSNPRRKPAATDMTRTNSAEPPLAFETVVRLNLATAYRPSLSSGAQESGSQQLQPAGAEGRPQ